ncbi:MAG: hypothetical protein K2J77_03060 [Oscillospiraceae bacterium]|nr:hypothetical protein [Oscillospiraceae bacterium]
MKKVLKVTAWLCLIMAVAAVVCGFMAFSATRRSFFMGYSLFGIIANGGIMGFIGNLAIIAFTVICYGLAGLNTLVDRKKEALIWSAITSLLALVALVTALLGRKMTLGDVVVAAVPVVQTLLIIKSAD